ncbi:MAG: hypothetical protein N2643_02600 [Endomicrobia bacterium]|nr:hypothetical protein [Endomicrobiia bacterium]
MVVNLEIVKEAILAVQVVVGVVQVGVVQEVVLAVKVFFRCKTNVFISTF